MNILDFDLELDLNVNFISPMWPENDLSDVDTNAILTDHFSIITNTNTTTVNTNTDLDWNNNEEIEELYSGETKNNINGTSNVPPYYHTEQTEDNGLESWPDTGSLFKLEVFNECLNSYDLLESLQVENTFEITSSPIIPTSSINCSNTINIMDTDPLHIREWNRRRSLIYDKNEFKHDNISECYERRIKNTCGSPSSSVPTLSSNMDQRTFKCSVRNCDKTYNKASHLKSHMRRHTGVKPFACDWDGCKWRFSRSDELARHKRSHSGIKPYACNLCEKAFSRSDHLSKHSKVHMKKLALYGTPIITKKCNYKYLTLNRISIE